MIIILIESIKHFLKIVKVEVEIYLPYPHKIQKTVAI